MALKIKLKRFTASSGDPSTSDLEVGEVGINPVQKKIFVNNSGTIVALGSADFSAVDQDIIPDGNGTRSLGSTSKRFKELFLLGQTIDLGGAILDSDGSGQVSISATGVTLPAGSKTETGNELAVLSSTTDGGTTAQVSRLIPFFTKAGGLSTVNTRFQFNATIDNKFVFTGSKTFTLANGSALADSDPTLFQF